MWVWGVCIMLISCVPSILYEPNSQNFYLLVSYNIHNEFMFSVVNTYVVISLQTTICKLTSENLLPYLVISL